MKKILILPLLSLMIVACDRPEKPTSPTSPTNAPISQEVVTDRPNDNSSMESQTSSNLSEIDNDRLISKKIRQAIKSDGAFSDDAKNIRIITLSGIVTLRGSVMNEQEYYKILEIAKGVAGDKKIDNRLEISQRT